MHLVVRETAELHGQATAPGSKSQAVRALLLSLLAEGESIVHNVPDSEDINAALTVCRQLGADVSPVVGGWRLVSRGMPLLTASDTIHSANSGITTRFVMPMLGLRHRPEQPIVLDCDEQMRHRPIQPLVEALTELGLTIDYLLQPGQAPLKISGALRGGKAVVDGLSSQYLSALLLALPCASEDSTITVTDLHERPYVDMTLNWLQQQGMRYQHQRHGKHDTFMIKGGQSWQRQDKHIHADFSSASYLIAAAALLPGDVILTGMDMSDPQGDKRLVEILQAMGADIVIEAEPQQLVIQGGRPLHGLDIDANDIPDLLPTLAVIATQAVGKTRITNVGQARIKETDRIHSMSAGLAQMGANITVETDGLTVYQSALKGAENLNSYGDHRTVMALALAGLTAIGETVIQDAEAMNKTFPQFVDVMRSLGADMESR